MQRVIVIIISAIALSALSALTAQAQAPGAVVADVDTRLPLAGATVFDSRGNVAGICNERGRLPRLPAAAYPVTVRCLG